VVDDAIIVVENVHRHIEEGKPRFEAALMGARELALPIIAMTTTLVAVYAPIGFMGGLVGTLFTEFAFALAGAVLISGVVALTLSPMLSSKVLKPHGQQGRFEQWVEHWFTGLAARYQRMLHGMLDALPVDGTPEEMRAALQETVKGALESQVRYTLDNTKRIILRAFESEPASIDRLLEAAGIAYEGIEVEFQESGRDLDPHNAVRAVSEQTGLQIEPSDLQGLQGRQLERAVMDRVRDLAQMQTRLRMMAQVQIRSGVQFPVERSLLNEPDEQVVLDATMRILEQATTQGIAQLLKEAEGEIEAKIRRPGDCTATSVLRFLNEVRFGTRTQFDKQHRRVSQRTERFQFGNWVADQVANQDRDWLEDQILEHLDRSLTAWEDAWGRLEMQRIGSYEWSSLDEKTRAGLRQALGDEQFAGLEGKRVSDLTPEQAQAVRAYLGERVMFNVQRQLMLDITSRYWVEHLTAMEVLRQGIGLQSYGQKDPLAEYKVRAYDMFQELLLAIQADVVAAMFTYRPRDLSQLRAGVERKRTAPAAQPTFHQTTTGKRRKRKKRRS